MIKLRNFFEDIFDLNEIPDSMYDTNKITITGTDKDSVTCSLKKQKWLVYDDIQDLIHISNVLKIKTFIFENKIEFTIDRNIDFCGLVFKSEQGFDFYWEQTNVVLKNFTLDGSVNHTRFATCKFFTNDQLTLENVTIKNIHQLISRLESFPILKNSTIQTTKIVYDYDDHIYTEEIDELIEKAKVVDRTKNRIAYVSLEKLQTPQNLKTLNAIIRGMGFDDKKMKCKTLIINSEGVKNVGNQYLLIKKGQWWQIDSADFI